MTGHRHPGPTRWRRPLPCRSPHSRKTTGRCRRNSSGLCLPASRGRSPAVPSLLPAFLQPPSQPAFRLRASTPARTGPCPRRRFRARFRARCRSRAPIFRPAPFHPPPRSASRPGQCCQARSGLPDRRCLLPGRQCPLAERLYVRLCQEPDGLAVLDRFGIYRGGERYFAGVFLDQLDDHVLHKLGSGNVGGHSDADADQTTRGQRPVAVRIQIAFLDRGVARQAGHAKHVASQSSPTGTMPEKSRLNTVSGLSDASAGCR